MVNKIFDEIGLIDLKDLITNQVLEGKTLEYKSLLKLDGDAERKEFLYDITSFANAAGGDIVFGITEGEEKGIPLNIDGVEENIDELCRIAENLIRDCIAPRISGILMKSILLETGKNVLVIRIPKSINAPHQVTFKGVDRFYSRANAGKFILDVYELRNAFLQSSQFIERIRTFIEGRIRHINAFETPVKLEQNPKIALHLFPLQAIHESCNLISIEDLKSKILLPLGAEGYSYRVNLEGVLNFSRSIGLADCKAYVQLYRSGIVETVNADLLKVFDNKKLIYVDRGESVEENIISFVASALEMLQTNGIQPPVILFLHFIDVKGYGIGSRRLRPSVFNETGINSYILQLPEIVSQNYPVNVALLLKDWFDTIWNACGYEKCLSYDAAGNFTGF